MLKHARVQKIPVQENYLYVQEILCEARQFWERNGLFSPQTLQVIDDAAPEVFTDWSSQSYNRRQLITQLNEVENQLTIMEKEVKFLKMQANEVMIQNFMKPICSMTNSIDFSHQNEPNNRVISSMHMNLLSSMQRDLQTQTKIEKRFNRPKLEEFPLPKRTNYEKNVNGFIFPHSSVLLTPSPEPQDRLSPPPQSSSSSSPSLAVMTNKKSSNSNSNFWMSMMKIEEKQHEQLQQEQQFERLFIPLLGENIIMPFLYDSFDNSTEAITKAD